ncbi:MAG: hypothetical protein Q8R83_06170 [Legionellaceae bacterium]|nr:hypothetical protein [Legionellaceae bacterium]
MKTLCTCLSGKTNCDCHNIESIATDGTNINRKDMTKDTTDYKQLAYKLQGDIEMRAWEDAQKNIPFLKEMKQRIEKFQNNKDVTEIEMVYNMIDHWILELERI